MRAETESLPRRMSSFSREVQADPIGVKGRASIPRGMARQLRGNCSTSAWRLLQPFRTSPSASFVLCLGGGRVRHVQQTGSCCGHVPPAPKALSLAPWKTTVVQVQYSTVVSRG